MTETNVEAPALDAPEGNRKRLLVAGAAGVAVLGAGGFFLLHHGSDASTESFSPVVHHVSAGKAKATTSKSASRAPLKTTLPAATTVKIGRDPFAALYVVPVAPPPSSTTTATTGTGAPATSGTTAGGTTAGTSQPAVPTRYTLKLLSVTGTGKSQTAAFSVAGKTQYARVGSVFGRTSELKLLSFQQIARGVWSVTVQVGDDNPADLAKGESISVL